jgi:Flp pilus assembly protein TadG
MALLGQIRFFTKLTSLRRMARENAGGMMIEFAFVAPFVILLLVSTVEVGFTLFVGSIMEGAAENAARQIRTGQVQESDDPVATFQARLCQQVFNLIDCNFVVYDVRSFNDFGSVDTTLVFDENGQPVDTQFTPGESGEITIVRVMYRLNFMTPLVAHALSPDGTGSKLLMSTMAFQNEPYELGG